MGIYGPLTHNGITPELCHLPNPHGAEQRLPDLQLEHLAHDDLHGHASFPAVVDHCPLKVILQCLEVEGELPQREPSVRLPSAATMTSAVVSSLLLALCSDWQLSLHSRRLYLLPT